MYRFFLTRSGRCYVAQGSVIYFYHSDEKKWLVTDRTVADLQADSRVMKKDNEDGLPTWARHAFRKQFGFDSRRVPRSPGKR